ncbi:MAG TPA: methionyl-tRNA formyltransferase [Rectinemataceae bacterium]|nr:methionyl-tRNA formyltransferase [Rectinemataceae bacterium]
MRILFAGSPAIAVPTLLGISERHRVVGILTNPESGQGRGKEVLPTAVAIAARQCLTPPVSLLAFARLDAAAREAVAALEPDILVVFAYGKIFGPKFLSLFPRGGINIHPSLLPRHRGSSPIQQAILDRDGETGVSVQALAPEMDSGSLFAVERIVLTGRETAETLSESGAAIGARLALKVLDDIEAGKASASPQAGTPTYCKKIAKEDGLIDWTMSSLDIDARIRAFDPWPGAYTYLGGQRLNLLEAFPYDDVEFRPATEALPNVTAGTIIGMDKAKGIMVRTGDGWLALRRLQFSARKALPYRDFANGLRTLAGLRFEARP